MTQGYSDEWRKALIERDMAVRAIQKAGGLTDGFTRLAKGDFPEFDNLKQIVEQFKPKALR